MKHSKDSVSLQKRKNETVVAIFAHPDDEAFGPAGTIAKYAKNSDVFLVCVTRGESGMGPKSNLAKIRSRETLESAGILGVKKVYFLNFVDGTLSNNLYHKLASKLEKILNKLKPQIIITDELRGISGHIDHIVVSLTTTYVFKKLKFIKTLMYYCIDETAANSMSDYFIYFPPGYKRNSVDKIENVQNFWQTKVEAMFAHKSQIKDAKRVLKRAKKLPKEEYFFTLEK